MPLRLAFPAPRQNRRTQRRHDKGQGHEHLPRSGRGDTQEHRRLLERVPHHPREQGPPRPHDSAGRDEGGR